MWLSLRNQHMSLTRLLGFHGMVHTGALLKRMKLQRVRISVDAKVVERGGDRCIRIR